MDEQGRFEPTLDGGALQWHRPLVFRWVVVPLFASGPAACAATFGAAPWGYSPEGLGSMVFGLGLIVVLPLLAVALLPLPVWHAQATLTVDRGTLRYRFGPLRRSLRLSDVVFLHVVDQAVWIRRRSGWARWARLPLPPAWGARTSFLRVVRQQHDTATGADRVVAEGRERVREIERKVREAQGQADGG